MKQSTKEKIQLGAQYGLSFFDGAKNGIIVGIGWVAVESIPVLRPFKRILKPLILAAGIADCFVRTTEYPGRVAHAWDAWDLDTLLNVSPDEDEELSCKEQCSKCDACTDSGMKMQIGFRAF